MKRVLPILFNTEMVQAILSGEKCCTRRIVKCKYSNTELKIRTDKYGTYLTEIQQDIEGETHGKRPDGTSWYQLLPFIEKEPPYRIGDILYVREIWCWFPCWDCGMDTGDGCTDKEANRIYNTNKKEHGCYAYKASFADAEQPFDKWYPSIHMPKEAARIWLRVTGVRAERLQEITVDEAKKEGANLRNGKNVGWHEKWYHTAIERFEKIWDSTIKKADMEKYGWEANPWVWVIEFVPCKRPDGDG